MEPHSCHRFPTANDETDRPELKLVTFVGVTAAGKSANRGSEKRVVFCHFSENVRLDEKISHRNKKKTGCGHCQSALDLVRQVLGSTLITTTVMSSPSLLLPENSVTAS